MNKLNTRVQFHFQTPCNLPDRSLLKTFIISVFRKEKKSLAELNIVFCDDDYLLTLNKRFLRHNYYTDILSFPLSTPGRPLVAEMYISTDRVRDNAGNLQESFQEELHRVIFHGILHFLGFKDKSAADINRMRAMEDRYLKAYFVKKHKAKDLKNKR
jgi:probable rRNA maturation factor